MTLMLLTCVSFGQTDKKSNFHIDTICIDSSSNKRIYSSIQSDPKQIRYNCCPDCIRQEIFDEKGKFIAIISIDSKGKVRCFVEANPSNANIRYDEDGNIRAMEYVTKKGKRKQFLHIN